MVSGIEAIGLVLAIFPVAVEVVDGYKGLLTGRDVRLLVESLKNQEQIFLNSAGSLLRSILPASEVRKLLGDPQHETWLDENLNQRVISHLGDEAAGLLDTAGGIYKTVLQLREKLPPPQMDPSADQKRLKRVKIVLHGFMHGPHYKASLERLKSRVIEFRMLTEDALKLASERRKLPQTFQNLRLIRDGANGLYNILKEGWLCDCEELHPAHMRLDMFSPILSNGSDVAGLKFSFLFADDARRASSHHWRTAEIVPLSDNETDHQSSSGSSGGQTESSSARSTPSPARAQSRVTFRPGRSAPASQPSNDNDGDANSPVNLCSVFNDVQGGAHPPRHRIGIISDSKGDSYGLFTAVDQLKPTSNGFSASIADVLRSHRGSNGAAALGAAHQTATDLSNRHRVELGLALAWGVLQLSSTSWLEGYWTKENILLVIDPPQVPRPYVRHCFQSTRRNSVTSSTCTLSPTSSRNQFTSWVRNEALFALAVFLLELCHGRPIEELAQAGEKEKSGEPFGATPFLTAVRLSNDVQNHLGMQYAQAVKACLYANFESERDGPGHEREQLARGIMEEIIKPLESVAKIFGATFSVPVR